MTFIFLLAKQAIKTISNNPREITTVIHSRFIHSFTDFFISLAAKRESESNFRR